MKITKKTCNCQPLTLPFQEKVLATMYRTYRQWWKGHPATGAVLIRSRMSGFKNTNMDKIIFPALKHVIALGHDFDGAAPPYWKDGKYFEKEFLNLNPLVDQGTVTWPNNRGSSSQSYEIHKMSMSLYNYLEDDLSPPPQDSDRWTDIFIYQYDEPDGDTWGRAEIGYYHTYKHYNIQLNEGKMTEDSNVNVWASVIFHEMMHNWGWNHDDNHADRREYIFHADQIIEDLIRV